MPGKERFGVEAGYWLARAKRATRTAAERIEERTGAASTGRDRAIEQSGATRAGRATGSAIRSMSAVARRLPVSGLTTDVLSARHGLGPLAEHLRQHPDDPMAGAWLVEAMARADAERHRYRATRTAVDRDHLARSTYVLATARLRTDAADGRAWHALARVHLARGDAAGASRLAKLAVLADPTERAAALVTLARAELVAGSVSESDRFADLAVAAGQTVGWEVRAGGRSTAALDVDDPAARRALLDAAAEWSALVTNADRVAYHGVHVDTSGVVRAVASAQRTKSAALVERARGFAAPEARR